MYVARPRMTDLIDKDAADSDAWRTWGKVPGEVLRTAEVSLADKRTHQLVVRRRRQARLSPTNTLRLNLVQHSPSILHV